MGLGNLKPADYETMVGVQKQLAEVLSRANRNRVEAGLAVFALARLMRELLNNYPEETRKMLVDQIVVPFLQGEAVDDKLIQLIH